MDQGFFCRVSCAPGGTRSLGGAEWHWMALDGQVANSRRADDSQRSQQLAPSFALSTLFVSPVALYRRFQVAGLARGLQRAQRPSDGIHSTATRSNAFPMGVDGKEG